MDPSQPARAPSLTRRGILFGGAAASVAAACSTTEESPAEDVSIASSAVAHSGLPIAPCTDVPPTPVCERPPPTPNSYVTSAPEALLAFRNHGFLMEFANQPVTPLGVHYLLIHFDVPQLSAENYTVAIGGRVRRPRQIPLREIMSCKVVQSLHTMECAGTGRHLLTPRPIYVPWFKNPIGTYRYVGTPLAPLLREAGILDDAVEVLFTGWDVGVDLGVEHAFERSMPIADALRPEVMLAWEANCQPLLPQHGFPLRLIVPSWYGMASVKWLRAITVLDEPFQGVEQARVYRYRRDADDPGVPVREKRVNSVMKPPGLRDLQSAYRFVAPGAYVVEGKAWSGFGPIARVDFSADDGRTWRPARLQRLSEDPFAWVSWRAPWNAEPGRFVLRCRAFDAAGNSQPLNPNDVWNYEGNGVNAAMRVHVIVEPGAGTAGLTVPSTPRADLACAIVPPRPDGDNENRPASRQRFPGLVIDEDHDVDRCPSDGHP
ncbi:sulfite oxidase [Sorangium cellulosum]|uniref:Sulfite oxidase n=1 Tax=Sorangium cellulosum TaxID=56 RepID=A0A150TNW4_SORCE|nr:sulfite oxidase [Sorangium cellulosum]